MGPVTHNSQCWLLNLPSYVRNRFKKYIQYVRVVSWCYVVESMTSNLLLSRCLSLTRLYRRVSKPQLVSTSVQVSGFNVQRGEGQCHQLDAHAVPLPFLFFIITLVIIIQYCIFLFFTGKVKFYLCKMRGACLSFCCSY